jgi:L-iditol 2-dehydrogenase
MELIAAGKIQVTPLITAVAPLSEGARWFERLHAREANLMKIVIDPGSASNSEAGALP